MHRMLSDEQKLTLEKISLAMGGGWRTNKLNQYHTDIFNPETHEKISCWIDKKMWRFNTCLPHGYSGGGRRSIGCSLKKPPNVIAKDIKRRLLCSEYIKEIENSRFYFDNIKKRNDDLINIKNALSKVCKVSGGYHNRFSDPVYLTCENTGINLAIDLDPDFVSLQIRSKVSIECLFEIINLLDQDKYR